MSYLLIGNYGVSNLGDEALKQYFLEGYPEVDWRVLSAYPQEEELPRLPCGIRSLLSLRWIKTLGAYKRCEGVVFGGGSLFTDTESIRAPLIWWWHAFVARLYRKDIILAFQGIGPLRSRLGTRLTRWVLQHATLVIVRDQESVQRVKALCPNTKVIQSFDPVLSLIDSKITESTQNILILIPRRNSGETFLDQARGLVESGDYRACIIISMHGGDRAERSYCIDLQSSLDIHTSIISVTTLEELIEALHQGSFVLTERYHGALVALALCMSVSIVSQTEGDKLWALARLEEELGGELVKVLREKVDVGEDALNEYFS